MTTATKQPVVEAAPVAAAPVASTTVFGTTSLVLAIVGIVLGQGLISVAAVILAFVARAKEPTGRLVANWGLALGFVGVFGGLLLAILGIAAFIPVWVFGAATGLY
jgi:hypothetical protein